MSTKDKLFNAALVSGLYPILDRWNDGTEPYSSGEGWILKNNKLWNPYACTLDAFLLMLQLKYDLKHIQYGFIITADNKEHKVVFTTQEGYYKLKNEYIRLTITDAAAKQGKKVSRDHIHQRNSICGPR